MVNKIIVRPMKKSDLKKLAEIYSEVYRVFDVGEKWNKKQAQKLLAYWFKRQPDLAFVAECDGAVAGAFIAGIKPWWNGNHLVDGEIFVSSKHQKKGVGSLLTRTVFEKARKKYNAKLWDTYTFKKHEHPLKWYRSMGFNEIKEWTMISGDIRKALKLMKRK